MTLQWVVSVWFFSAITKNYGNRNLHGKCFDIPRRQFSKKCACKYISKTISFQLKKKLIIKITEMTFVFPYLIYVFSTDDLFSCWRCLILAKKQNRKRNKRKKIMNIIFFNFFFSLKFS